MVAHGHGLIADEIIPAAQEHQIYVHQSTDLLAQLMQVDLDREVPPSLYRAIAELLAWLYQLERAALENNQH